MLLEVSIGEAVDKYCILELKLKYIPDETKLVEIRKELTALDACAVYITEHPVFYKLLFYVNECIWNMTNEVKGKTPENIDFASLANQIFEFNQKRFRIKNWFNMLSNSLVKEQKSYSNKVCKLNLENVYDKQSKLLEIYYLLLEYDIVLIDSVHLGEIVYRINTPTLLSTDDYVSNTPIIEIDIDTVEIPVTFEVFRCDVSKIDSS
jgi:hypothetical protein